MAQRWVWSGLASVCYWSGLTEVHQRQQRARGRRSWTVLAYHRIGAGDPDGGPDRVLPKRFLQHLRYLVQRYEIVTVGEALARLQETGEPGRPLLSITFDDGYRDNVETALPILLEARCRATLYVTLEAIERGVPPWTHQVACDLRTISQGGRDSIPRSDPRLPDVVNQFLASAPRAGDHHVARRIEGLVADLKQRPDAERRRICSALADLSGGAGLRKGGMLSPEDLRRWKDAGMEVGSHTAEHAVLSRMSADARQADLARSKAGLQMILGAPVLHLAYPNGRLGDWDDGTVADARAAGFQSAVTTVEGINHPGPDPFAIRRISVGDDHLPVFATRVSGLLSGLRTRARGIGSGPRPAPATDAGATAADRNDPQGRRLRIAFIGGRGVGGAYSGIERYYEEVGSRLSARGHRLLVYCRPHFAPPEATFRGMQICRLPTIRAKHLETLVHTILSTIDVCFRRVDLVQFHALGSSPFAWLPRLFGKKTVVSVRGLDWQRAKWGVVARTYLRLCERTSVHCPNATAVVSRTLLAHYRRRFNRPVSYIPNGVVRHEPVPPDGIREWGLRGRDYFLYAGRLSPEKGLDVLIEAHRGLAESRLVIAGGSSYSDDYTKRLRARAHDRVLFTGFITGRLLHEMYSNALAFVLPSQMEGLSVALLEAISYGLPVIASDIPENRELVDECGGFLFRLDDERDLRRAMQSILDDRTTAMRTGARARDIVRACFDWDRIALDTEALYLKIVDGEREWTVPYRGEGENHPAATAGSSNLEARGFGGDVL